MSYDAVLAETVRFAAPDGALLEAYAARPLDPGPRGGVVVIHHLPGYDRETREHVRRLAVAGFDAVCPNLYSRVEPGSAHDDQAAAVRAAGGVPDEQVMGDVGAAMAWLRALTSSNGRVATLGFCSGGRQSFLAGCTLDGEATVCCYPGLVVGPRPDWAPASMHPLLDRAGSLGSPLLAVTGNDDQFPSPVQVDELEAELTRLGKRHEVHRYDGAGHSFLSPDRDAYRPAAAVDAWERITEFLARELAG